MKRVILLGSSGSIGQSTCKVARHLRDEINLVGLAVHSSTAALHDQFLEFHPEAVAVCDQAKANETRSSFEGKCKFYSGPGGLENMVRELDADIVLVAIVGTSGLRPALAALQTGKNLAVASKEILVMAGESVMRAARENNRLVLPVDSEHNAIFQCLQGAPQKHVHRLVLTASGGPFRTWKKEDLHRVQLADALKHPTWDMGRKITIDSASMFNKGLEMIEAKWLFGVGMDRIEVIVHPQSLVHSMVEFTDFSVLAQLSCTDMCFPIQYALTYPDRKPTDMKRLDLAALGNLVFEAADENKFPALRLAKEAGSRGGTLPAVFNAANEVAVQAFIDGKLAFPGIWETVEKTMQSHETETTEALEPILKADSWARETASKIIANPR